jgi:hypothetical protein
MTLAGAMGGAPRAAALNGVLPPRACPARHVRPTLDWDISQLRRFGHPTHRAWLALASRVPD